MLKPFIFLQKNDKKKNEETSRGEKSDRMDFQLLLKGANIVTLDDRFPEARAVGIGKDGRINWVGEDPEGLSRAFRKPFFPGGLRNPGI